MVKANMEDKRKLKDEKLMMLINLYDDREAFEIIMDRYKKKILNLVLRITGNFHVAEEISQDVFVSLYLNRKRYDIKGKFSSLIFKIAINKSFNYLKKGKELPLDSEKFKLRDNSLTPYELALKNERKRIFEENLQKLSPVERTALILYVKEGKSYNEIANLMECSLQSVKNFIHRGKLKLIKLVEESTKKSSGEEKNV